MSVIEIPRVQQIRVYQCDGPNCEHTCDEPGNPHWSSDRGGVLSGCGWIDIASTKLRVPGVPYQHANDMPRLYFCSWDCVTNWTLMMTHSNVNQAA